MNPNRLFRPCPHEPELKALLAAGQWPIAAPAELRSHVVSCRACSDLALLTGAFQAERAIAASSAQLPPPGVLWWRAQLLRRNAALERMNRPILGAQLFAFATLTVTLIGFALLLRHSFAQWLGSLSHSVSRPDASYLSALFPASTTEWLGISWNLAYVLPITALFILAGGVAVYMASERT